MEKTIVSIPGYRVHEYLLVLRPHEELWNRIMHVKENFAEKFRSEHARWSRPYLTIASFLQYEMKEERLINSLQKVAMGFPPFKVELKDFGSFPSHTIYINVTSKVPVQQLVKEVRSQSQKLMKLNDEHTPHFMLEPHITIARKLLPWQYEKAWLEYSHSHFTGRFIASSMALLRRPSGDTKYYTLKKFAFENLPVATRQGELFP